MFRCADCGEMFEIPKKYTETHGLETPPYEIFYGCPRCAGAYSHIKYCSICGEPIIGEYIILANEDFICNNCYIIAEE